MISCQTDTCMLILKCRWSQYAIWTAILLVRMRFTQERQSPLWREVNRQKWRYCSELHTFSFSKWTLNISATRLSDHLKWRLIWQKTGNYVRAWICLFFWLRTHAKFNIICFLHLSEHRVSFQASCWYVNLCTLLI